MDTIADLLALAIRHHTGGDLYQAEQLYRQIVQAGPTAPQAAHAWYLLGTICHAQGKMAEAEEYLRLSLQQRPDFAEGHYHLGITLAQQSQRLDAEECFRHALRLKPDFASAMVHLGNLLASRDRSEEAEELYRQALRLKPADASTILQLAHVLILQKNHEAALACYEAAAQLEPASAEVHTSWGSALIDLGRTEEAIVHLKEALALKPSQAVAYGYLSELVKEKFYRFTETQIAAIRALLADRQTAISDRIVLQFTLASVLDKQGHYDEAFVHYQQGNRLKHMTCRQNRTLFDTVEHRQLTDDFIAGFNAAFFQRVVGFGHSSQQPIFIVGMPRSGTTLVDQILSAHPEVAGAGELFDIANLVAELPRLLNHPHTLDLLAHLEKETVQTLAQRYLDRLVRLGGNAVRITDKMPFNYSSLGFIATLFPQARVVHCRRNPLDTCFSCYTHHFADFCTSLESLGFYYGEYERLMNHWRAVLPLQIHEVQYEELVAHQEAVSRDLIAFCGLEWDERCLAFHENSRAVHTASRMQVRQPIYGGSVGRWKKYAAHLEPLRKALSFVGEDSAMGG